MAGIPPMVGFFAKYRVLYSAIENGYYFMALVGILASVVSAAYYLRVIRVIHFDLTLQTRSEDSTVSPSDPQKGRSDPQKGRSYCNQENIITRTHSYVIAVLTLVLTLFILSPSL